VVYPHGLNGLWKGDEHPAYASSDSEYGPPFPFITIHSASLTADNGAWYT